MTFVIASETAVAMMDVVYTEEEMDFLAEAAEHFRDNAHRYSGSYFELVNTATLVPACRNFLEAYRHATLGKDPDRPTQDPGWVYIRKAGDDYHLQADDALSDLTCIALRELHHDPANSQRLALITAIIAKSWPKDSGL